MIVWLCLYFLQLLGLDIIAHLFGLVSGRDGFLGPLVTCAYSRFDFIQISALRIWLVSHLMERR
jgi:hypothetical protein